MSYLNATAVLEAVVQQVGGGLKRFASARLCGGGASSFEGAPDARAAADHCIARSRRE